MNRIETRPSVEDRVSFEGYAERYQLNPYDAKVQESFKQYLLYKMDKIKAQEQDSDFTYVQLELRLPSLSLKRLKHLAYLVSITPAEREVIQNMNGSFNLHERNLPNPRLFARGFHQMSDSALQWNLASELERNPTFQMHFQETLKAHLLNEPEKEIEKMEKDLAQISNSSLFKQYLRERRVLDQEGRLIRAETPFETKQVIDSYLQLLAHVLECESDSIATIDLKAWDEKISSLIYKRFLVAVDKNPKWKKNFAELQSSEKSAAEKIEAIKERLSKENQVQKLLDALSIQVDSDHIESLLADPFLSSLGLGFPQRPNGLFLEEWHTKQALKSLYLKFDSTSVIRSKVEDLCRAIGIPIHQRQSVYELYNSYRKAFKEKCSELQNPLHVLLAKEAHLNRDTKVLEQMRPKLISGDERIKLSPTESARTSNQSQASEGDVEFQALILDKGLQSRLGTREYRELLSFARNLYENPVRSLFEFNVDVWSPKIKDECFKWLSSSFFTECLDVDLESDDNSNLKAVLESFHWHAENEIERLGLPSIYFDMLASGLSSGNVKRLKLIADEIAYARYQEANPYRELAAFKEKTISEKIESTKNYLKKMKDRSQAGYLLSYMESFPVLIEEVSEEHQTYIDLYLAGSHRQNSFYRYLEENKWNPLSLEKEKRLPYLFYLQKKFVKQLMEEALKPRLQNKGAAALACELKTTHFLDLNKLDFLAELIESGQEVDMDFCLSWKLYKAACELFIDSLSEPSFDAPKSFLKIKDLSTQKALLDALEKKGYGSVIHQIIMKGSHLSYLAGYEWLRDRIKNIPEEEFIPFFLKYFREDPGSDNFAKVLERRNSIKAACEEFKAAIKEPQFLNSPIRALLQNERMIDGSGDLIRHIGLEEIFMRLDLCLITQRDFLKINRERAQLEKRMSFLQMNSGWLEILTEINADMEDALEKGISLDLSAQEVEELIRRGSVGAAGNSIFFDYLKEIELEKIKGLLPREYYKLYVFWMNNLIKYFESKLAPLKGKYLSTVGNQAYRALEQGVRAQNWHEVNINAKILLLTESVNQEKFSDPLLSLSYQEIGHLGNLSAGFVQKSLESDSGSDLLKKEEDRLDVAASLDRKKWIQQIKSEIDVRVSWMNRSCLKALLTEVNDPHLSILEKKRKVDSLMLALAKVLAQEFERLKMSASYKDFIERAFSDGDGSLWDFLLYEAAYGNYQSELEKLREKGEDVSILDALNRSIEKDLLQKKIAKIMNFLGDLPELKSLLNAIDPDRFKDLVSAEIATN